MIRILVFMGIMTITLFAIWLIVALSHYYGWVSYDVQYGTTYRFNEGGDGDILLSIPKWMERILRKYE
jgi:hypothetical protein